ncbi:Bifunctional NADP phosphatase/NAD kinase [uncultured archaeon]|nr:Bifunctional NADP phosphatase/NAD kinase [uncultured archaeon]
MKIRTVGVATNPDLKNIKLLKTLNALLEPHFTVLFSKTAAKKIGKKGTPLPELECDILFSVGGDGTLLSVLQSIRNNPLILGINTGRVGYLNELAPKNIENGIKNLLSGNYTIDKRTRLTTPPNKTALNEISIHPKKSASLLEFYITLNDYPIANLRADGLLISTPTGSTGYNLSQGGPILHPDTHAFVITPISPFLRSHSPIVVPDTAQITVRLIRPNKRACLVADSNVLQELEPHSEIKITRHKKDAQFVRFDSHARDKHAAYNRLFSAAHKK